MHVLLMIPLHDEPDLRVRFDDDFTDDSASFDGFLRFFDDVEPFDDEPDLRPSFDDDFDIVDFTVPVFR